VTIPLLLIFALICCLLLLAGMLRRGAIYEFPFLAGAVFAGFALPQFIGLSADPFLPPGALEKTLIMASLCAAMCWTGYAANGRPWRMLNWEYDEDRLLKISVGLSIAGCYFYYAFSQLPDEVLKSSQMTGLPVAYLFFARLLSYGFAIAVLLYARSGSKMALMVALFGSVFYLERIVIAGRRADLIEFCTIIALAAWFQRGRSIPRLVMLIGLVLGTLLINSTGDYRGATMSDDGPQWNSVLQIDFVGNLERLTKNGGPELTNAVYYIEAVDRTMKFDLGLSHWNELIFRYVPAQLLGADFKSSLVFTLYTPVQDEFHYTPATGSTLTGLTDAFQSFWYFGCLEFFLIGLIMNRLWRAASLGDMSAQLAYVLILAQALHSITHSTDNFVAPWAHMAMFLVPALMLARRASSARHDEATAHHKPVERPGIPAWAGAPFGATQPGIAPRRH
jgi:glycerol uptake facilitator-like aquaporin